MIELFLRGGPLFMLPLLVASIGVIAIAIERILRYRQADISYDAFLAELRAELKSGGVAAAHQYAESIPGPVARVWAEGLAGASLPLPILRERMEGAAASEVARLERHLPHVEVVGQIAPLVGILGTVWGMIVAFEGVAGGLSAGIGVDGERLTRGIAQALVTTGAGLAVAIPATVVDHYLRRRVDRFIEEMERGMRDVVLTLSSAIAKKTTSIPVPAPAAARSR